MTPPAPAAQTLPDRILDAAPPAAGATVMGTGIVSVALLLDRRFTISDVLLVIQLALWVTLVVLAPARARRDWRRFQVDLRQPAALTAIAGTGVLGVRLTLGGWGWAGVVLLVTALALWVGVVPRVLRHWKRPTIGASFLITVATDSLALLTATVSLDTGTRWLVYAALVPLGLGLAFYVFVLAGFDFRQLTVGMGDHWVTGGALAISTLTAGRIALVAHHYGQLAGGHGALRDIALVLWCLTMAWLPALLVTELLHPRLSYSVPRWSTVFPFGMYAACSFIVGALTHTGAITDFARVWVWVAFAVWVVVMAGMLRRGPQLIRGRR